MNRINKILFPVVMIVAFLSFSYLRTGASKIKSRFVVWPYKYTNWDAPWITIDSCLDHSATHLRIPDDVEYYGKKYRIVEIGPNAFRGCRNLEVLEMNGKVLGTFLKGALYECPNLRVIKILDNRSFAVDLVYTHPFYGGEWYDVIEPYHTLTTVIVVPEPFLEIYRNAPGWRNFKVIQSHDPDGSELDVEAIDEMILRLEQERDAAFKKSEELRRQLEELTNYDDTDN